MSKRALFLQHVGQTSKTPVMIEVDKAEGMYIIDTEGKKYLDMNSGIAVSSVGHCHPDVVKAVQTQSKKYMHTMVYGEHVQSPQISFASRLTSQLSASLSSIYYVMTGTEATEAAMKLAKRITSRTEIISCSNAYHGSTQGAESLRSDEDYKQAFYPLLPDIKHIRFNHFEDLERISRKTACVILEPVQAEAGVITPETGYLEAVRDACKQSGALMVLDEIQTGFGRTGQLFAHQKYDIVPDILLVGKAMGGGMPIAGFVTSQEYMDALTRNPALGHITTFGGHPVSCAAADASLKLLLEGDLIKKVEHYASMLKMNLVHPLIKEIRNSGLMMAVELTKRKYLKHVVSNCLDQGLIVDYFLFNKTSFRLAPPLIIEEKHIKEGVEKITMALDFAQNQYIKRLS